MAVNVCVQELDENEFFVIGAVTISSSQLPNII